MSQPLQYRTCRHLSADGVPCGSPALRGEYFCYYHHRDRQRQKLMSAHNARRITRLTPDLLDALQLPAPDDPASIRVCIATLMRGILSGLIDRNQAGQVLYLIQLATINNQHATDFDPEAADVHAITDPEPIVIPADPADAADRFAALVFNRDSADSTPDSSNEEGSGYSTALAVDSRSEGYANLEVVMVCPRDDFRKDLKPTDALRPATLDEFDRARTTPPAPREDQHEDPALTDMNEDQEERQVS
jgi:hypothetical protein